MSYITANSQPVLQIIHVSDMHVVATNNHPAAPHVRWLSRRAAQLGIQPLVDKLADGLAAHDPFAPFFFSDFVDRIATKDSIWSTRPTWVVDTGDQTTFGDDASLSEARTHLMSFAGACPAPVAALTNIYGNHDAWPEDIPISGAVHIPAHRMALESAVHGYAIDRAQAALRTVGLPTGGEIQLFTIDTVNDDFWSNTWARGRVDDAQLDQLDLVVQNWATNGRRDVRILATHHPIHFPPPRPFLTMSMANDDHVGTRLSHAVPFVHLVLSGHTHKLYPKHGDLPGDATQCLHDHLGPHQCQLVVGTLMQEDVLGTRGDHPHQCQVLRIWHDPKDDFVVVQRLLAARNPHAPQPRLDYEFVTVPGKAGVSEEIRVSL